jgi:hypothetical protein
MVMWQPTDRRDATRSDFTYHHINNGDFDHYIRAWATKAKAWGGRIIIRFAHEMDGRWFPWGIGNFDNTPKRFVKAWRRIWNIFKGTGGVGATNVRFLWSPLAPCTCRRNLYPGDHYVDYVGMTALNWGAPHWEGLLSRVRDRVAQAAKLSPKPVIIAEAASSAIGGDKAFWLTKGYRGIHDALPSVKAIVYFDIDMSGHGQPDWRLTTPPKVLGAYANLVASPKFQGRIN